MNENELDSKFFIVEVLLNDRWVRYWSYDSLTDAVNKFRELLMASDKVVARITSPTNTSIYS